MYDIRKNYEIARSLATGGIILLKNEDNVLPLNNKSKVGVVGKNCLSLLKGGGGSSQVKCEYVRSLEYGLIEKSNQKKFNFYEASLEIAAQTDEYTTHQLNELSKNFDTAIVTVKRHSFEGGDRKIGKNIKGLVETGAYVGETDDSFEYQDYENKVGYYYPSSCELMLFKHLEESEIKNVVTTVPVIIVFSLFIAVLLNQEFRGRALARTVFFLPVVIGSGIVISIIQGDQMSNEVINGTRAAGLFESGSIFDMLEESGLNSDLIGTMMGIVNNIFELSWHSGLQIILFLAALQTVPDQLYEVARVEGATSWEIFFKITLPMITPILLVNIIYTLVDTFTDYGNSLLVYILDLGKKLNFEYSAALGNIYFVIIFAIIGLVLLLIGRMVTYVEK